MTVCQYCQKTFEAYKHKNGIDKKFCSKACRADQNSLNTALKKKKETEAKQ